MTNTLPKDSILTLCEEVALPEQLKLIPAGTVITSPGDYSDYVFVVKSGVFKLSVEYNSKSLAIEYLFAGYIAGLVNLHQAVNYPCLIKTVTESSVYVWERKKILELMSIIPEFSNEIQRSYSDWGLRVVERIKALVFLAPYQRVAAWVYDYNKYSSYKQNKAWAALSNKDMAEFCNVTEIEFNNSLCELAKSNVIHFDNDNCSVQNWDRLSYIINSPV